ncbi:MAG: hypothetical protein KKF89_05700 [Nanoarchaeota archaeon]|nr:hypothetical protein [Nanoarchaeota archaeon]MBU1855191.1 hypothetical protein [Nanoarchaeota archaeon]
MTNIVLENLELMISTEEEDGLHQVVLVESVGGNAGFWNNYPCAGVNFHYNPENGKIAFFGDYSLQKKQGLMEDSFRIAINLDEDKLRILDYKPPEEIPINARINLRMTVEQYNKNYGF